MNEKNDYNFVFFQQLRWHRKRRIQLRNRFFIEIDKRRAIKPNTDHFISKKKKLFRINRRLIKP